MSPLHLFDRQQDFAYQQEVAGNPAQRHHVRFWRCPEGWMLPGGYAPSTGSPPAPTTAPSGCRCSPSRSRTRSTQTSTSSATSSSRDVTATSPEVSEHRSGNFSTGYHSRNGGGDRIETDGDLPVLDLDRVDAPARAPAPLLPPLLRAPPPTVFGAGVAAGRGLLALAVAAGLALSGGASRFVVSGAAAPTVTATALGFAAVGLLDLWLARAVVRGSTWARLLLLLDSSVLILDAASSDLSGGPRPTLGNGLPTVTLSILVMLALSSTRAREYARAHSPGSRARAGRTQPSPGG